MLALIDMDYLVYQSGFACQKTSYDVVRYDAAGEQVLEFRTFGKKKEADDYRAQFKDGDIVEITPRVHYEPVENALHLFKEAVEKILRNTQASDYRGYLTGSGNFREAIATIRPYKGNRDPLHKPVHYQALRDYAVSVWGAEIVEGQEADDQIAQEHARHRMHETVVVSVDKDFLQLPGWNYSPTRETKLAITPDLARRNFWVSVLTGDATDNIVGAYGVGPVAAHDLLAQCATDKEHYDACLAVYNRVVTEAPDVYKGLSGEQALAEMASLLYLRRTPDDVWAPPK